MGPTGEGPMSRLRLFRKGSWVATLELGDRTHIAGRHRLYPGDVIRVDEHELRFELGLRA